MSSDPAPARRPGPGRPERLLAAALALLACVALASSPDPGALWSDEHRTRGRWPLRWLMAGEPGAALESAFSLTHGRPGLALAYAPGGLLSTAVADPDGPLPPEVPLGWYLDRVDAQALLLCSAAWAALAVLAVGRLAERVGDRTAGALAAWWLAGSVVLLHYGRTLLPPVAALALGAAFLDRWLAATEERDGRAGRVALQAGLLLGAACSVYPGVYALGGVVVAHALHGGLAAARGRIGRCALGFFTVLLAFEASYRLGFGGSYLGDLRQLAPTIDAGDPREGWSFPLELLWTLDGAAGAAVLGLSFLAAATDRSGPRRLLATGFLLLYLEQAVVQSTVLGRQAIYGRIVAPWLSCMVPLAAARVAERVRGRRALLGVLLALLVLHQAPRWVRLARSRADRRAHPAQLFEQGTPAERREGLARLL